MKFVCGECQAKYQIPDARVAGRKLKIRCRRCGAAIYLRGDLDSAAGAFAPRVGAELEWHVALDGEQHGPYPSSQMASMLREGQLPWDAHVWREGYGDWRTADESDTLVRAVAAAAPPELHSLAPMRATSTSVVPEDDDDAPTRTVASPMEDDQATVRHGPHGGRVRSASPSPRAAVSAAQVRARSYAPGALSSATGARSEDSVLFAAQNLTADAAAVQVQAQPARAGYASGEGSGLIDIRALATIASQPPGATPRARAAATVRASDVFVPMSASKTSFGGSSFGAGSFGTIDSLAPFDRPASKRSKTLPIAIVLGSTMIAAGAFLAVYMTRGASLAPAAAAAAVSAPTAPAPVPLAAVAPEPAAAPSAPAEEPPSDEPVAPEPSDVLTAAVGAAPSGPEDAAEEPVARERSSAAGRRPSKPARAAKARSEKPAREEKPSRPTEEVAAKPERKAPEEKPAPAEKASVDDLLLADPTPAPAPEEAKPKQPAGKRSIDELLDSAVVEGSKKKHASAAPAAESGGSDLPETPGRDEVRSTMKGIEPDVKACIGSQTLTEPTASVAVTVVGSTGKVQSVRVSGIQGSAGSCIARVVRGAKFSPFSKASFTINYPYKLQ